MAITKRVKIDVPFATDAEVEEMVAAFEACRWPYPWWTHRAHIGVAAVYLTRHPFDEVLARVRHHINLYNRTCGDADGYHETLTVLFLRRVAAELCVRGERSLAEVVNDLTAECDMTWPLRFYSPELLWSAEAKAGWVEPDREEIPGLPPWATAGGPSGTQATPTTPAAERPSGVAQGGSPGW